MLFVFIFFYRFKSLNLIDQKRIHAALTLILGSFDNLLDWCMVSTWLEEGYDFWACFIVGTIFLAGLIPCIMRNFLLSLTSFCENPV